MSTGWQAWAQSQQQAQMQAAPSSAYAAQQPTYGNNNVAAPVSAGYFATPTPSAAAAYHPTYPGQPAVAAYPSYGGGGIPATAPAPVAAAPPAVPAKQSRFSRPRKGSTSSVTAPALVPAPSAAYPFQQQQQQPQHLGGGGQYTPAIESALAALNGNGNGNGYGNGYSNGHTKQGGGSVDLHGSKPPTAGTSSFRLPFRTPWSSGRRKQSPSPTLQHQQQQASYPGVGAQGVQGAQGGSYMYWNLNANGSTASAYASAQAPQVNYHTATAAATGAVHPTAGPGPGPGIGGAGMGMNSNMMNAGVPISYATTHGGRPADDPHGPVVPNLNGIGGVGLGIGRDDDDNDDASSSTSTRASVASDMYRPSRGGRRRTTSSGSRDRPGHELDNDDEDDDDDMHGNEREREKGGHPSSFGSTHSEIPKLVISPASPPPGETADLTPVPASAPSPPPPSASMMGSQQSPRPTTVDLGMGMGMGMGSDGGSGIGSRPGSPDAGTTSIPGIHYPKSPHPSITSTSTGVKRKAIPSSSSASASASRRNRSTNNHNNHNASSSPPVVPMSPSALAKSADIGSASGSPSPPHVPLTFSPPGGGGASSMLHRQLSKMSVGAGGDVMKSPKSPMKRAMSPGSDGERIGFGANGNGNGIGYGGGDGIGYGSGSGDEDGGGAPMPMPMSSFAGMMGDGGHTQPRGAPPSTRSRGARGGARNGTGGRDDDAPPPVVPIVLGEAFDEPMSASSPDGPGPSSNMGAGVQSQARAARSRAKRSAATTSGDQNRTREAEAGAGKPPTRPGPKRAYTLPYAPAPNAPGAAKWTYIPGPAAAAAPVPTPANTGVVNPDSGANIIVGGATRAAANSGPHSHPHPIPQPRSFGGRGSLQKQSSMQPVMRSDSPVVDLTSPTDEYPPNQNWSDAFRDPNPSTSPPTGARRGTRGSNAPAPLPIPVSMPAPADDQVGGQQLQRRTKRRGWGTGLVWGSGPKHSRATAQASILGAGFSDEPQEALGESPPYEAEIDEEGRFIELGDNYPSEQAPMPMPMPLSSSMSPPSSSATVTPVMQPAAPPLSRFGRLRRGSNALNPLSHAKVSPAMLSAAAATAGPPFSSSSNNTTPIAQPQQARPSFVSRLRLRRKLPPVQPIVTMSDFSRGIIPHGVDPEDNNSPSRISPTRERERKSSTPTRSRMWPGRTSHDDNDDYAGVVVPGDINLPPSARNRDREREREEEREWDGEREGERERDQKRTRNREHERERKNSLQQTTPTRITPTRANYAAAPSYGPAPSSGHPPPTASQAAAAAQEGDDRPPSLTPSDATLSTATIHTPTSAYGSGRFHYNASPPAVGSFGKKTGRRPTLAGHESNGKGAYAGVGQGPPAPSPTTSEFNNSGRGHPFADQPRRGRSGSASAPVRGPKGKQREQQDPYSSSGSAPSSSYRGFPGLLLGSNRRIMTINFSDDATDPYFSFSPRSPKSVYYRKKLYSSAEHLFQAMRFLPASASPVTGGRRAGVVRGFSFDSSGNAGLKEQIAEEIRRCPTVDEALAVARAYERYQRRDWSSVQLNKLEEILYLKFTQHNDLLAELIATHPAQLAWTTPRDAFLGLGVSGKGRNELGQMLVRVRTRLKEEGGL